jgi:hypothetical protein
MRVFISSVDDDGWYYVKNEYKAPTNAAAADASSSEPVPKPKSEYTDAETKAHMANIKALNAIFTAVSEDKFKLIATCETAKEAWDILETVHEGTEHVRELKLQLLLTGFENLRMNEEETIDEFSSRVKDISNKAFQLGKKFKDVKLVRKVLRSLPKRFAMKVTAFNESNKNLGVITLDELMGSLKTYEIENFSVQPKKQLAFNSSAEVPRYADDLFEGDVSDTAMISRNFNRMTKNFEDRRNSQVTESRTRFQGTLNKRDQRGEQGNNWVQDEQYDRQNIRGQNDSSRLAKCKECGGVGHLQSQCTNLKLQQLNKSLVTSWSEDDEEDGGKNFTSNHVAFGARFRETDGSSSGYNPGCRADDERGRMSYEELHGKWIEACDCIKSLGTKNVRLTQSKTILRQSLGVLQQEKNALVARLEEMTARAEDSENAIRKLNKGKASLEDALSMGQTSRHGLGYVKPSLMKADVSTTKPTVDCIFRVFGTCSHFV